MILIEQVIRRDLVNSIRKKRPGKEIEDFLLHQDNAPAHRADSTVLELDLPVVWCFSSQTRIWRRHHGRLKVANFDLS